MKVLAKKNNVRVTPRKMRLVADLIRNHDVETAIAILNNTNRAASAELKKVLLSAKGNAINNFKLNEHTLVISEIQIGDGITMKRFMPRAKGSSSGILKRTSNIRIVVEDGR